jgi:hypothetical protein
LKIQLPRAIFPTGFPKAISGIYGKTATLSYCAGLAPSSQEILLQNFNFGIKFVASARRSSVPGVGLVGIEITDGKTKG